MYVELFVWRCGKCGNGLVEASPAGKVELMRMVDTADGSRTLYSERYGQTMHSYRGALAESRHVFLGGAGVAARLEQGEVTRVLEVGFGTGLNFFVTADAALKTGASLDYVALERDLLPSQMVRELGYEAGLEHKSLVQNFLEVRDNLPELPPAGHHVFNLAEGVELELRLGDATSESVGGGLETDYYDAVYMDAFSPDVNPELWTEHFLKKLYDALRPGGILSSYCVKGNVRRHLQALGFAVQKRPGPPSGKREMLVATK